MVAGILISTVVAFFGGAAAQTLSDGAHVPEAPLIAVLSKDDDFKNTGRNASGGAAAFIRRHISSTDVTLDSGVKLSVVRVVLHGLGLTPWCGSNCPFSVWMQHGGTYTKVLALSAQEVEVFRDGSLEVAGHASGLTEDYTTYRFTGTAFVETGYFDTQGNHENASSAQPIVFDPGSSFTNISGSSRGSEPDERYAFFARAGQTLTLVMTDRAKACRFAIDRGGKSYVIASGSSLTYRLPEDGQYTIAVVRTGLELANFSFFLQIV